MLTLYRRHRVACKPGKKDPRTFRCACPIWLMGTDSRGDFHRETLGTSDPTVAEQKKRAIDLGTHVDRISLQDATDAWLNALVAGKRSETTLRTNHRILVRRLLEFAKAKGITALDQLDLVQCDRFVGSWTWAPSTHHRRLRILRAFFWFCVKRKWIKENPASYVISPMVNDEPTLPYTAEEEAALFAATKLFRKARREGYWTIRAEQAAALMLVLRHTGLRISDALQFDPKKITHFSGVPVYETYQTKTGEHVFCPLPESVVAAVQTLESFLPAELAQMSKTERNEQIQKLALGYRMTYLRRLGEIAGVSNVHPHRFRDTFAVQLLNDGVPLEDVSKLLGHTSIKTTERHYAPWVRSRQNALIQRVTATWKPVHITES